MVGGGGAAAIESDALMPGTITIFDCFLSANERHGLACELCVMNQMYRFAGCTLRQ